MLKHSFDWHKLWSGGTPINGPHNSGGRHPRYDSSGRTPPAGTASKTTFSSQTSAKALNVAAAATTPASSSTAPSPTTPSLAVHTTPAPPTSGLYTPSQTVAPPISITALTTVVTTNTRTTTNIQTTTSAVPPISTPVEGIGSNTQRVNNQLVTIAAATSGVVILLVICTVCWFLCRRYRRREKLLDREEDWKWFDTWGRRHKSMSIITDKYSVQSETLLSEGNVEKLAWRTSGQSTNSAPQWQRHSSVTEAKDRVMSMSGITNTTGTTSDTQLVIARPAPSLRGPQSYVLPTLHGEPHVGDHYRASAPVTESNSIDDALTAAGVRNARLLFILPNGH